MEAPWKVVSLAERGRYDSLLEVELTDHSLTTCMPHRTLILLRTKPSTHHNSEISNILSESQCLDIGEQTAPEVLIHAETYKETPTTVSANAISAMER